MVQTDLFELYPTRLDLKQRSEAPLKPDGDVAQPHRTVTRVEQ